MIIDERKKEIRKLTTDQYDLLKKIEKIAKLKPAKTPKTAIKRCAQALAIALQLRSLEVKKHTIASQPIPKYPKGTI